MDFYTSPIGPSAYVINNYLRWFKIPLEAPDDATTVTVIAVSTSASNLWIVAYAVLTMVLFSAIGKLVTGFVITWFPVGRSGNRHAMLVAYYNSNTPSSALAHMWLYLNRAVRKSTRKGKHAVNWDTVRGVLWLSGASLALMGSAQVANFFVGGKKLVVRNASLANEQSMFLPSAPPIEDEAAPGTEQVFEAWAALRAAAVTAAVGRVQSSQDRLKERVLYTSHEGVDEGGNKTLDFTYKYHVDSIDWGLQFSAGLTYAVVGHCTIEWSWLKAINVTTSSRHYDMYVPWGDPQLTVASFYDEGLHSGPRVNTFFHPNNSNIFAMQPATVYRNSISNNTEKDPWYETENETWTVPLNYGQKFRVKPGRAMLQCVQNDTWSYGGESVNSAKNLPNLPGLKLSTFIRDRLFVREFTVPPIAIIANVLGSVGLRSGAEYSPNTHSFNASQASIQQDLARLAETAFVYSREVVRNTVLFNPNFNPGKLANDATPSKNDEINPGEYQADFIIESQEVAALRVSVLLAVPALCIIFWAIVYWRGKVYHIGTKTSNSGYISRHNLGCVALVPMQLYRLLDEEITKKRRWSGRKSITPYIKDLDMDHTGEVVPPAMAQDQSGGSHTGDSEKHAQSYNSHGITSTSSPEATGKICERLPYSVGASSNPRPVSPSPAESQTLTYHPYIMPKLVPIRLDSTTKQPVSALLESELLPGQTKPPKKRPWWVLGWICFWWPQDKKRTEKYELVFTDVYRRELGDGGDGEGGKWGNVKWEEIRHNAETETDRWDYAAAGEGV